MVVNPIQTSRVGELERINPTSIETISSSISFPINICDCCTMDFATSTSRQAADSNADPLAMSKNRHRSADRSEERRVGKECA